MSRDNIFISYSQEDSSWLSEVKKHLSILEHKYKLVIWDDTKIRIGSKWQEEIETAIKKCKIAILLVSHNFLASRFIAQKELPKILSATRSEEVTIINVIIDTCAFELSDLIGFQCLNDPDRPLSEMRTSEVNKELVKLATTIVEVFNSEKAVLSENESIEEFSSQYAQLLILALVVKTGPKTISEVQAATLLKRKIVFDTLEELNKTNLIIKTKADIKGKPSVLWKASALGQKSFDRFEQSYLRILEQPSV
jgi:hypothetical protein